MSDKTLGEIIEDVKSGQRPEYDDLRYALLTLNYLHAFDWQDMLEVYDKATDPFLKWKAEESFNRSKRVMGLIPKDYLGPNWNPDNPIYQADRKLMNKLLDKITGEDE